MPKWLWLAVEQRNMFGRVLCWHIWLKTKTAFDLPTLISWPWGMTRSGILMEGFSAYRSSHDLRGTEGRQAGEMARNVRG